MKPEHEMTPRQYRAFLIRQRMTEHGCSAAEAAYDLTPAEIERRHSEVIVRAADSGISIRREVLDAMGPARFNVLKWHSANHAGYIPPEIRKQNKERPLG